MKKVCDQSSADYRRSDLVPNRGGVITVMKNSGLTYNAKKALMVNIGESAGTEIANLFAQMAAEIEELRRSKVSVTKIVPQTNVESIEENTEPV